LFVSSTGENGTGADVISFLLLQLKSDPTVRQVLMLTQKPTGGFSMGSQQKQLQFNASGDRLPGSSNGNRFEVNTTNANDEWTVTLTGADAVAFAIRDTSGSSAPLSFPVAGDGAFTITASDNALDKALGASAIVTMGPQSFEIKIAQAKHVLSITPTSVMPVLVAGGSTPEITVNSSATGKAWTATIVNATPQEAKLSVTTGTTGGTFHATFPRLEQPFIVPQGLITVTMDDYPWLTATLTVSQQSYQPRVVTLQTANSTYGRLNTTGTYFNYMSAIGIGLRDKSWFGPAATVRTAANSLTSWPQNATVSSTAAIFLVNSGLSSARRANAVAWKNANNANLLLMLLDRSHGDQQALLRSVYGSATLTVTDARVNDSDWRNAYSFAAPTAGGSPAGRAKLWAYLVGGEGPFGKVNPANVWLEPYYNNVDGTINNPPSTMMRLVTVNGQGMLYIDPTRNVVVIGNMDMFSATNDHFLKYPDKYRFLQNFLAYMVNAAQYGEVFLNQFK
jgi:hypothetical protein